MSASGSRRPRPFSVGQRRALVAIAALFIGCVAIGLIRNRSFVADPQPVDASRAVELLDRLDPNVADARQLSALPGLGDRRAGDVVAYRERAQQSGHVAFRSPDDLLRVNGIGVAIARQIEPFLAYPTTASTTVP